MSPHTTAVIITYKVNTCRELSVQSSFLAVQNTLFHRKGSMFDLLQLELHHYENIWHRRRS